MGSEEGTLCEGASRKQAGPSSKPKNHSDRGSSAVNPMQNKNPAQVAVRKTETRKHFLIGLRVKTSLLLILVVRFSGRG